ncbi:MULTISPECIES: hypothetical protein [unclassified Wolbachia]|nr:MULTISPECIES: hypothetical protein [unclassified Wolbachia]
MHGLCTNIETKIPVLPFLSSQCVTLGWLCCIALRIVGNVQ